MYVAAATVRYGSREKLIAFPAREREKLICARKCVHARAGLHID